MYLWYISLKLGSFGISLSLQMYISSEELSINKHEYCCFIYRRIDLENYLMDRRWLTSGRPFRRVSKPFWRLRFQCGGSIRRWYFGFLFCRLRFPFVQRRECLRGGSSTRRAMSSWWNRLSKKEFRLCVGGLRTSSTEAAFRFLRIPLVLSARESVKWDKESSEKERVLGLGVRMHGLSSCTPLTRLSVVCRWYN